MDEENKQKEKSFSGIERGSDEKEKKSGKIGCEVMVRVLALVLTLATAVILGVSKETKLVSVKLLPTLPSVYVPSTAKATYLSAFVYNISASAIACGYAAVSVAVLMVTRGRSKGLATALLVGDLVMVALLFSGTGAAGAIGLMGYQGNKHVMWNKVCNVFGKFCHTLASGLVLSLLASTVFLILVLFDSMRLPNTA